MKVILHTYKNNCIGKYMLRKPVHTQYIKGIGSFSNFTLLLQWLQVVV